MEIDNSDNSGQTGEMMPSPGTMPPSQEVSRVPVDGIASGAPAGETLPEPSLPPQEVQPSSPPAAAPETPLPAEPTQPIQAPPPEPAAPVPPPPEADETNPQAGAVDEALKGTPGALGNLEENVAGQGQTFQEQGENIGEVAAADQAAEEVPIPTPEQAPEVSADTPDAISPVSPLPAGDVLPPAAPPGAVPPAEPAVGQRPEDLLRTAPTGEVTRESFQKAVEAREAEEQRRILREALEKTAEALRRASEAIEESINNLGPSGVETGINKGEK